LTPKTNTPATTAGGAGGEEPTAENTTVSDTGTVPGGNLQFGSKYKRRLSNSSQVNLENLENVANKNPTNVRFPKGAHARLRSNSIGNTGTLESMKRTQKLLVGTVNSVTLGLSEWFTEQERQTEFLKEQVTDMSNQLKQAHTDQRGQMLSQKALRDQLEQTPQDYRRISKPWGTISRKLSNWKLKETSEASAPRETTSSQQLKKQRGTLRCPPPKIRKERFPGTSDKKLPLPLNWETQRNPWRKPPRLRPW
jgi:hypothetical protein